MNNTKCLHCLIKQIKEEKNHKLKVIVAWDECLQPLKSAALYNFLEEKNISYPEFFKRFWETTPLFKEDPTKGEESISDKEKLALEKYLAMRKVMRKSPKDYANSFWGSSERFNTPFTNVGKELLLALKENLLEKLIIISAYRKGKPTAIEGKRIKFEQTFGHFPQCELELTETVDYGKEESSPSRAQRIAQICPDFDIFVEDKESTMKKVIDTFSQETDKAYVLNDYKRNRQFQSENLYHLVTSVSDLNDDDFVKVANEWKQKEEEFVQQQVIIQLNKETTK